MGYLNSIFSYSDVWWQNVNLVSLLIHVNFAFIFTGLRITYAILYAKRVFISTKFRWLAVMNAQMATMLFPKITHVFHVLFHVSIATQKRFAFYVNMAGIWIIIRFALIFAMVGTLKTPWLELVNTVRIRVNLAKVYTNVAHVSWGICTFKTKLAYMNALTDTILISHYYRVSCANIHA